MNSADIIAIAAAVVSACALFTTIWQAVLTRSHNRLSVRPLLVRNIDRNEDGTGATLTLRFKNCGIGPAIIKERGFWIDDKRFEAPEDVDEIVAVFQSALASKYPWQIRKHGLPGIGAAIHPGGEQTIASVFFPKYTLAMAEAALKSGGNITFRLKYESLYGESYEVPE